MSWLQFKLMTLEEFRSEITYRTACTGEKYYSCPMCKTGGPVKGLRERYARAFGVTKSSLDFIDDVELIYRSCVETARRSGIIK
jgi:hypothetical protein